MSCFSVRSSSAAEWVWHGMAYPETLFQGFAEPAGGFAAPGAAFRASSRFTTAL